MTTPLVGRKLEAKRQFTAWYLQHGAPQTITRGIDSATAATTAEDAECKQTGESPYGVKRLVFHALIIGNALR
jgi:hypothetical protein